MRETQSNAYRPGNALHGPITIALLVPCIPTSWSQGVSRPSEIEVEDYTKRAAVVGFEWVDQPVNQILLLRSAHAFCAIRFLSYRRANDSRSPTAFDTGDASQFAIYEISELALNGAAVLPGPVASKELDYRGMRGLGRLAFGVGDADIRCGGDKYSWMFPTGLLLKEEQADVSIAPTNWTNLNEVRDHSKLRWYQRDAQLQRARIVIPMENLPP